LPLERTVAPHRPLRERLASDCVEFDASPWGGGAVRRRGKHYLQWCAVAWDQAMFPGLDVQVGSSRSQSFFEFFMVLVALLLWGSDFKTEVLMLLGDNTSALQRALSMKGRGTMLDVAREVAWRRARFQWSFAVAHLPSEANDVADALSRQHGPEQLPFPAVLRDVPQLQTPALSEVWLAAPDAS